MKILILAYDFPPLISIGGQRPYSWLKYLPQSGIKVTAVTRHWNDNISSPASYVEPTEKTVKREQSADGTNLVIRAPFIPNLRDKILLQFGFEEFVTLRKFLTYLYAYLEHLFFFFDSKSAIYQEAERAINESKPDIIIATGEPFILFKYAHYLSAKYRIPWVADYRDGWTNNQGSYSGGGLKNILNNFYRSRENLYISNATLITTAAPAYADALRKSHPDKKIEVIYNGFDEEFFQNLDDIVAPADKFILSYAGTVYPHQNLEMFLDGLSNFLKKESMAAGDLEVRFYGLDAQPAALERLLNYRPELSSFLKSEPRTPYPELIKKLRASHVLLLLSKRGADWLNAKIFDYLGVKRLIILVENDKGILEKILAEMNAGVALNSADEVSAYLKTAYHDFKYGALPNIDLNPAYLQYSRKAQAQILAKVLQAVQTKTLVSH